ncbi:DNA-3-methyladenine glycosylase I [Secundilactobacillus kimchicus]|nr:DNA-3-methyladenine glycosylase I [Secundilactobacillus kimchicus]MBT9672260.1 DNA-3-methyladenine glycosylase I [Secundilactobacillus kimchicus]
MTRCDWAESGNELMQTYHDTEWGFPTTDETETFELMVLEMMQAGLSWQTVLNKRAAFRAAFADFDIDQVAAFDAEKIAALMQDTGIIRNRRKIDAAVNNAQQMKRWHAAGKSLNAYLWQQAGGHQLVAQFATSASVPAQTPLAQQISKTLKKKGFKFLGPTIVTSWLQALGIQNDHVLTCEFRQAAIEAAKSQAF